MTGAVTLTPLSIVVAAAGLSPGLPQSPSAKGGRTKLTWYGQAAFRVETPGGGVILIDPWLSNPNNPRQDAVENLGPVDYIVLTHGHFDHVGDAVTVAKATGAHLVSNIGLGRNLVRLLGYPEEQATMATLGNVGGTIDLPRAGARVTFTDAVHGSEIGVPEDVELPVEVVSGGNATGVVLRIEGGPTIYHTGDTDVFPGMELIGTMHEVDVMLACIGDHFTMGPRGAAHAAGLVQPERIVPMHYGTFPLLSGTPDQLQSELKRQGRSARMVAMQPGESREL